MPLNMKVVFPKKYTTFVLGEFEVFRENLENAAKVPADAGGSIRSQGVLSGVLTKVDYGCPKGVIRVCR
jgi:hypothetical protein